MPLPIGTPLPTRHCHAGHDVPDIDLVGMTTPDLGEVRLFCVAHADMLDAELEAIGATTLQM